MSIIEEIKMALLLSTSDDLCAIRQYIGWMRLRRRINNHFYFKAHWLKSPQKYHWVR